MLEDWPFAFDPAARNYTTVMSWKTDVTLPNLAGTTYGGKDVEFMKFIELPRRVRVPLEVALSGAAPRDELHRHGWQVVDAYERSCTLDAYRDYLRRSRAEWSIAKNAYVASHSGWFSTRSAAYLALGRPVVVQDTGFRDALPDRCGSVRLQHARRSGRRHRAASRVTIELHCEAARAVAEREFAAEAVLTRLLHDAGL